MSDRGSSMIKNLIGYFGTGSAWLSPSSPGSGGRGVVETGGKGLHWACIRAIIRVCMNWRTLTVCGWFRFWPGDPMKTITLDDEAYGRLKAWKRGAGDSFSQVVKRVVPEPGTLGAFLGFVEARGTDRLPGGDVLESCVEERPEAKADPWTS